MSDSTAATATTPASDCDLSEDDELLQMLTQMCNTDSDIAFRENGYKRLQKIGDTKQGDLCKAQVIDTEQKTDYLYVAIRRTDKLLFEQKITFEDEHGFIYCVDDDCIEEANVLHYLSTSNSPIVDHISKFVDFFESSTDFFLATEYISSGMNLAQFIAAAKEHIDSGQLSMMQYQRAIRRLLRQLFVTVHWLHDSMRCCHLDLRPKNILVENVAFIQEKEGLIIAENICIKLANFNVAKLFININNFSCGSSGYLQIDSYSAPKVFNGERFDARCADNWSLGMIFFQCITAGHSVYELSQLMNEDTASVNGYLETYLQEKHLWSQFNCHSFEILHGLLNVNASERLNAFDALGMRWFEMS